MKETLSLQIPQSSRMRRESTRIFSPVSPVVNEVWREQTLNRLLNLVELPLLEGVLQYNQDPPTPPRSTVSAHRNPDLIFSSNHLDRQILEAFKDSQLVELKIILKKNPKNNKEKYQG